MLTPERIWQVAKERPQALALSWGCRRVTYRELVLRAAALADDLVASPSYGQGSPIAISTDVTLQMIIGALACWRVRCPYLPLSPSAPAGRTAHMLAESKVKLVLGKEGAEATLSAAGDRTYLTIDRFSNAPLESFGNGNSIYSFAPVRPDDLAYVIYTSGSTGSPKGVAVSHSNLANLIDWHHSEFEVTAADCGTQMAALTFDASVLETWPLLAGGATLLIPDRSVVLLPQALQDLLVREGVTLCFTSTAVAEQMMALAWPAGTKLRALLTGGDTLGRYPTPDLPFAVVNNYGPTECTVLATSGRVPEEKSLSGSLPTIGWAIPGASILILDSNLKPVKDGERGEICVAGECVAAGYMGRPDLTAERFVQRPDIAEGKRFYRTGDVASKLPSGEYQYWGRVDDQIKIRGFRIEPGELVAALREHAAIEAAAVGTFGEDLSKQLVAWVVLKQAVTGDELRTHLRSRVPDYMTPDCFVSSRELPQTAHGKVDRARLPQPDAFNSLDATEPAPEPSTEIQCEVISILSSLLRGRELALNDNFFRLGGNSLLAAQVIARVRRAFGIELPLRTIFESPTAAALSLAVEKKIMAEIDASQLAQFSAQLSTAPKAARQEEFRQEHTTGELTGGRRS